jgi:hypothetical protein
MREAPEATSATVFRAEHRQLPAAGTLIVTNEIRIAVCASQFEVPVVWREPRVEHLRDGDATVTENQCTGRLLAAMARVAFDANGEESLFMHPVTIRP